MNDTKKSLKAVGLTQRAIARTVGITDAHMSRIVSGECCPKMPLAEAIAVASRGVLTVEFLRCRKPHSAPPLEKSA